MTTWTIILIVVVWSVGAVLTYGLQFAYWQGKFHTIAKENYNHNLRYSLLTSLFFPLSLIAWLLFIVFIKLRDGKQVYYEFKFK